MSKKLVILSIIVRMALLSLSTMKSISQSPKRLPLLAFAARLWMADTIAYVGCFRCFPLPGFSGLFHLVATVSFNISRFILTYVLIDGFVENAYVFFDQNTCCQFRKSQLLPDQLPNPQRTFGLTAR